VVFELNSTGSNLNYGSYLSGTNGSLGAGIASAPNGDIYLSGTTGSSNYPVSSNALQPTCVACAGGGGTGETGFVTVLNPTASGSSSLVYSSFTGGSGRSIHLGEGEVAQAIVVDSHGDAYLAGDTNSLNFPTKGPISGFSSCPGSCPGATFVAKFDPSQSVSSNSLIYSTYFRGTGETEAVALAIDSSGDAYIGGATNSTTGNFPLVNAYQSSCPA
jgi:Beta-propeller repeat